MDVDVIMTRVDTAWQDAAQRWKDDYASRFRVAVIAELEHTLGNIRKTTAQLSEASEATLSSLQAYTS